MVKIMDWNLKFSERAKKMKASEIRELLKLVDSPDMISLAGGMPDPTLFPKEKIADIAKEVLLNQGSKALQYSATEGIPQLREILVKMAKEEGIRNIGIENVIVTTASQQALSLIAQIFINPGDTIITEAPTYLGAIQAFTTFEAKFQTVPMDKNGIKVDCLEKTLKIAEENGVNIKFIYVVPNFHNPAGTTLSFKRRLKILKLSHHYNIPIIEDDPYGEIWFEEEKPPSLVQLDQIGNVICLRTFSKRLFPGFRLGWVIAQKEVIKKLVLAKQAADLCSPALCQYIALEFIKRGYLKEYLKKVKERYKEKRDVMLRALERYFPSEVQWTKPKGGMFVWVRVPESINTDKLLKEAIREKIVYVPGSGFYPHREDHHHFRLNFTLSTPEQIEIGIQRLGNLLKRKIQKS
jgi:2-aminoadipate transaminase